MQYCYMKVEVYKHRYITKMHLIYKYCICSPKASHKLCKF